MGMSDVSIIIVTKRLASQQFNTIAAAAVAQGNRSDAKHSVVHSEPASPGAIERYDPFLINQNDCFLSV